MVHRQTFVFLKRTNAELSHKLGKAYFNTYISKTKKFEEIRMLPKKINRRRKITKTFLISDLIELMIKSDLNLYVYIHNSK